MPQLSRSARLRLAPCAVLLANFSLVAVAGCSEDDRAQPTPAATTQSGKGSRGGATATMTDGGAAAATPAAGGQTEGDGGVPPLGGAAPLGGGGDGPGPPGVDEDPGLTLDECPNEAVKQPAAFAGVCTAAKGWAAATDVAVESGQAPAFVAITASELTLLWTEARSSLSTYFLADRESTDAAFGAPQELPFQDVLGVSPDGLRLTLLANDGTLREATRAEIGDTFAEAEPGAYATLDANARALHLTLGDIAISADDRTLFYTARSLDDATPYPLHFSSRADSGAWPVGVALESCEWKAYGAFGPQPSAVSSDGLTLFYFDAARRRARAAFRRTLADDFGWFVDLPDLVRPQPNAACDRLYFSPKLGDPRLRSAAREP